MKTARVAYAGAVHSARPHPQGLQLADGRAGKRLAMPAEDEPFEFFRGFSEIFVSIGLVILMSGIAALLVAFGGFAILVTLPLICAAIAWWWAGYFTLKRRMNLPSMVLAVAFGSGIYLSAITLLHDAGTTPRLPVVASFVLAALGMAAWWITEAMPLPVTALLPLVVLPLLNIMPLRKVSTGFAAWPSA